MAATVLEGKVEDTIRWTRVARVATLSPSGALHVIPVCPALHEGGLYFLTQDFTAKARNIAADSRIAIVFDEYTEVWPDLRQVLLQGRAHVVGRAGESPELTAAFQEKYVQYRDVFPIGADDIVVQVEIDRVIAPGFV